MSSGSSSASASSSFAGAFDDDDAAASDGSKGAEATPLGLSVSNWVTVFFGLSWIAFLTGGGAGFGGTYCAWSQDQYKAQPDTSIVEKTFYLWITQSSRACLHESCAVSNTVLLPQPRLRAQLVTSDKGRLSSAVADAFLVRTRNRVETTPQE